MIQRLAFAAILAIVAPICLGAAANDRNAFRVQPPGICWEPDVEFPVPCDDDDD